jgi:hypothetical protein
MNLERPTFGASDVIELASKFEVEDGAFVIGGQATNLWAWLFQDEPELRLKGPFTSEDIDYFGSEAVARTIAEAIGGRLFLPDPDHHTPSTAQIEVEFKGKLLKIDFLNGVLGIHHRELRHGISVLEAASKIEGKPVKARIKVLHPVLCLKSRIVNILSPVLRRTDGIARNQATVSVPIVKRFISDALDDPGGWVDARHCFSTIYRYVRYDEYVKVADIALGIDPLDILRAFVDDRRIDHRYRNFQLKKMIGKIEQRRAGRRA